PYRTIGYPFVPLIFVVVASWLVVNSLFTRPVEAFVGLGLIALGLPLYLYFRRQQQRVAGG
ncbi:MAG: amino acid permease, partial [Acidobacteriota bacterium]